MEHLEHPRFLRSAHWGDSGYEGRVLDLLEHLCSANVPAIVHLVEMPAVQRKLDDDLLAAWNGETDPLVSALSHSLAEVGATNSIVDLGDYTSRVEAALPGDPYLAIGATKDLLEATMRTILDDAGFQGVKKLKFAELTNTCFTHLGFASANPPSSESEKKVRQIAEGAKRTILAANELRNLAGTGHGHVVGSEEPLSADDASMVASKGMILAAWLLRRAAGG